MSKKNRKKLAYIGILLGTVYLGFNISELFYDGMKYQYYFGISGGLVGIFAMTLAIRDINKKPKES